MWRLFAVLLFVLVHVPFASAHQLLPINFADLARASVAFSGVCTAVESHAKGGDVGSNLLVTTYTFSVGEVIKGDVPAVYSFTTLGSPEPGALRRGVLNVNGAPSIRPGNEYVLFLNPDSLLGLTSIVGFNQAKFNVIVGAGGRKQVVNDADNQGLFRNLPVSRSVSKALSVGNVSEANPPDGGAIDYNSFINMAREITK